MRSIFLLTFTAFTFQAFADVSTHETSRYQDVQDKDIELVSYRSLNLDHYDSSRRLAYGAAKNGCQFVLKDVRSFNEVESRYAGASSEKKSKWHAGAYVEGEKIKNAIEPADSASAAAPDFPKKLREANDTRCEKSVDFPFQHSCKETLSKHEPFYYAPSHTSLHSEDGKTLMVYTNGLSDKMVDCLKQAGFQLPKVPDVPAKVHTVDSSPATVD